MNFFTKIFWWKVSKLIKKGLRIFYLENRRKSRYNYQHMVQENIFKIVIRFSFSAPFFTVRNSFSSFADQYCHGIFSTMFWKLSLVVEKFFRLWRISHLRFRLFRLLFLYQIGYWWIRSNFVIFLLHAYDGSDFLAPYGNNWILCSLLFYQKDLCCCQDRLMKQYYYYYNDDYCVYILGLNHVYFVPNIFFLCFLFS